MRRSLVVPVPVALIPFLLLTVVYLVAIYLIHPDAEYTDIARTQTHEKVAGSGQTIDDGRKGVRPAAARVYDKTKKKKCSKSKPNMLIFLCDQLRYDAIGIIQQMKKEISGSNHSLLLETPNIDKLFASGVTFTNAYCVAPICVASRAAIFTGKTVMRNGMKGNRFRFDELYKKTRPDGRGQFSDLPQIYANTTSGRNVLNMTTYASLLKRHAGYNTEFYGKYHLPQVWNLDMQTHVRAIDSNFYDFITDGFGLHAANTFQRTYARHAKPLIHRDLDPSQYNKDEVFTERNPRSGFAFRNVDIGMEEVANKVYTGVDKLPANYTDTAILAQMTIKAIERLIYANNGKGRGMKVKPRDQWWVDEDTARPFCLTTSFLSPHGPFTPPVSYFERYFDRRDEIVLPENRRDPRKNNIPHPWEVRWHPRKLSDDTVRKFIALYYALIAEVDTWIGEIMREIDEAGMSECTMTVFTADHGEMMGSHGWLGKRFFYEESAKVPLSISFPGTIPSGKIIHSSVSHLDLMATLLDYAGISEVDDTDGTSLRDLIEGTSYNQHYDESAVVAQQAWGFKMELRVGNTADFMVRHFNQKLIVPRVANVTLVDEYYDLETDPKELHNKLGRNAGAVTDEVIGRCEHMKILLLEWLERNDHEEGYYSDPAHLQHLTSGDIAEVTKRRTWRTVDFWQSTHETLHFHAEPAYIDGKYLRNEYLYVGRTTPGPFKVSVSVVGEDRNLFNVKRHWLFRNNGVDDAQYSRIQVSYSNPNKVDLSKIDARIVIVYNGDPVSELEIVFLQKVFLS